MDNFKSQNNQAIKKKKKRWTPKGRQVEQKILLEIQNIFSNKVIKRDELIEYLHILQDNYGVLFDKHLVALSEITKLPLSLTNKHQFCKESLLVYPVINDIPCLLPENAIIATHFLD